MENIPERKKQVEEENFCWWKELLSTLLYCAVAVIITLGFIHFVGERTLVDGSSMESTLQDKDQLYLDKFAYLVGEPERFDIVVFPYPGDERMDFIKRIIGLPGETVFISPEGDIYINGELLEENYGKERIANPGIAIGGVTLGEDEYFVMGDNRNNSMDSRFENVGNIKRDKLLGRATFRFYPFSSFGKLNK